MDIFVSTDIEADGPSPGPNSMLSFGSVAIDLDKKIYGNFSANLRLLEGAAPDTSTTEFWNKNPEAYAATRINLQDPKIAMQNFSAWVKSLPGRAIFVGYPAVYDFKWIDWYANKFLGANPFGFSGAIDVKSIAWAHLGGEFKTANKKKMPKSWFETGLVHNHIALDDALEQGAMFVNMIREMRGLPFVEIQYGDFR